MRTLYSVIFAVAMPGIAAVAQETPMSAIDWLSQSVETQPAAIVTPVKPNEPAVTQSATAPSVTVTSLDDGSPDPIGLLHADLTGLPRTLWSASDEATLVALVQARAMPSLPALQDFTTVLMLAEADAPLGAGPTGALFLARVDKLLELGSLDRALSLLQAADPDTPEVFRRLFDVSLLTGNEDEACDVMQARPSVAPTYPARIYCLARLGDWPAAALTLNTHRVLGDVSENEDALLTRFLDPEAEDMTPLGTPDRISPLIFRMREAIGEGSATIDLPLAFANADLRDTVGWKAQLEAAERLARNGALNPETLRGIYTSRTPSASGGVWDRVDAMQAFDAAIIANNPAAIERSLPAAWKSMQQIHAEVPFAKLYTPALQRVPLRDAAAQIASTVGLLSGDFSTAEPTSQADEFLSAIARGAPQEALTSDPTGLAIQAAFNGATPSKQLSDLVEQGKLGEALLRAIAAFNAGLAGDTTAITESLALFRAVGQEDLARQTAIQLMILDREI